MTRSPRRLACLVALLAAPLGVAAEEISTSPSPHALEAMQLLTSEDLYQRQLGFLRLEALREASTIETIAHYVSDPEPAVRAYSLRALAAVQGAGSVPALLGAFSDKHPIVRRAAVLGLEPLIPTHAESLPALIALLNDRNPYVRMAVIDVLSRQDAVLAKEAVLSHRRHERDRDVKRVLNAAIKRLGR